MKLEDAPPPGWYPDPEGGGRLRWWEGTDWSDTRRAPATTSEVEISRIESEAASAPRALERSGDLRLTPDDTEQIISQVRDAARAEANRANELLKQRATSTLEQFRSALADYVKPVLRWIRIAVVVAAVLVIAWFVLQFIAQVTLLEWIGDRIDNVTSN